MKRSHNPAPPATPRFPFTIMLFDDDIDDFTLEDAEEAEHIDIAAPKSEEIPEIPQEPEPDVTQILPEEVLTYIFEIAWSSSRVCTREGTRRAQHHLLRTVSSVCTRWRNAAHNTPLLWSTIVLPIRPGLIWKWWQDVLKVYLERSRDTPLNLFFNLWTSDDEDIDSLFAMISTHSHRWRRLSIDMVGSYDGSIARHMSSLCVTNLEHFSLKIRDRQPPKEPLVFFNSNAPKLTLFRMVTPTHLSLPQSFAPSLKTLHLAPASHQQQSWAMLKAALEALPLLQDLSIGHRFSAPYTRGNSNASTRLTLPSLKRLRLAQTSDLDFYLDNIEAPFLTEVHLFLINLSQGWASRIRSPFPSPTFLSLRAIHSSPTNLRVFSTVFPNLRHISADEATGIFPAVHVGPFQDAEHHVYLRDPNPGERIPAMELAFPKLQMLSLPWRYRPGDSTEIGILLRGRKRVGSPILEFRISPEIWKALEEYGYTQEVEELTKVVVQENTPWIWPPGLEYDDPHGQIMSNFI